MGKHIVAQRRGRGGLVYRSPSHRHVAPIRHPSPGEYTVKDIIHAPGRNAPLLVLEDGTGKHQFQIAFNGAYVGQKLSVGSGSPAPGCTLPLGSIPDGSLVYNIESMPGDGGKFCRTAGTAALVVSHGERVTLKFPSGKMRQFHPLCMATVGIVSGSGAKDIPILKAGTHIHYLRSKAKWPFTVRGVAMNAVNHPHGGGNHQHVGRPSTVGRGTPPGRKVGRLSPKRRR
ncbi:50S ribosomal protein L2 [Thermogymnomonas acidicola]|uniref:50S ribosomal protein L2 n=1 Tax=Thermogymnomonas acidicola TaxID=399579 RepID=A0AA37F980_9ARCH|nr:50S ribosomal protein L2 [Thermogymnomonas acidicola]GGM71969.1 50S ribosomal protein L2 [Thermogymnomonas acidicola]